MSETSEAVEKPPEEPVPAGEREEDVDDGQSEDTVVVSKKSSEISMIEDQEMPTFSSVSSLTKPNNSQSVSTHEQRMDDVPPERDRTPSPEPSDEQDNESIYVVSSTADTDQNPDDIEDEEEDDYDSEDMIDEEDDDEDEDDYDARDDYDGDRYERESDEFEADRYERASDDFVLRHTNSIKKIHKERSQSLQDLSVVEARNNKRRNSGFAWERSGIKKNPYSYQSPQSRPYQGSGRYEHVESKVKRYIQDIKEQTKLSTYEQYMGGKSSGYGKSKDSKENRRKSSTGSRNIKDYAEKVIKKLEREESPDDENPTYATLEPMENGEEPLTLRLSSDRISTDSNMPMEVDSSSPDKQNREDKVGKTNGIIEFSAESSVTCTPIIKGVSLSHVNGTESSNDLVNLRTLSYEEYMRGPVPEEVEVESNDVCLISPEKTSPNLKSNANSIKITNVRSNHEISEDYEDDEVYEENLENSVNEVHQSPEKIKAESREISMLRASLNQRNAQFDCLQVAYQKTVEENVAMKLELESLKKVLKEHEKSKSRERKSTSVQTENQQPAAAAAAAAAAAVEEAKMDTLAAGKPDIKLSISSINSAVSSIHQWSESAPSPAISIQSPDVRKALNSDDSSVFENTPKKLPRTFSRAFITSSRILQTLSNITQGKTSISSPLEKSGESQAQEQEASTSGQTPLNSKKRKATELGATAFEQPFKIPHTLGSGSARKKVVSQDSGNETTSQMNGLPSESDECTENGTKDNDDDDDDDDGERDEGNMKKSDLGDGLKYFIYKDDENSKDRSFLIQAEDPGKVPNKGIVRECGPYLLGNLEVRMTEVNGTINIWGKEINLESTTEEFEISAKSADLKSGLCWQKTPHTNLLNNSSSPLLYSSTRRPKSQSRFFSDSIISKFSNSPGSSSIPKYSSPKVNERPSRRRSSLTADDSYNCNSRSHRLSWSGCKHLMEEQKHACCSHSPEMNNYERCGGCNHHNLTRRADCHPCNRVQSCAAAAPAVGDFRRHSFSAGFDDHSSTRRECSAYGLSKVAQKHESTLRQQQHHHHHQTAAHHCRRSFHDNDDDDEEEEEDGCQQQHFAKQCNLSREFAHSCNSKPVTMQNNEYSRESCSNRCCQNRSASTQDEDDPLISSQKSNEPPEVRKRRLSGKKVRGLLMDLLKGCGDCRTPNPANMSKSGLRGGEASYTPTACPPEIIVTACSPRASCSDQTHSVEKCCDTCSRRIEMTTEIETQLEFFRVEMERLRSRSDALLDKLSMLKSTE
ncbi:probable serine/threonine-protein kinase kinX isoform X2 [Belonocnema kinseyi]|uniref:probable serine/threonine-protein kinase kinX isoform X2 n=1 Tax=Belonocnema kinseyi TaxID=2817044 RepID=UPI00143DD0E7|nr:probable serine/threonine-protein kinase kinX isoform X2 [Belonocnema kinseyi]